MSQTPPVPTDSPYNTAYLRDARDHLYVSYDVDPSHDDGFVHPDSGEETAPPDYRNRRRAVVSFYGDRCGRCCAPVVTTDPTGDETLAYVLSLGEYDDRYDRWELEALVPLCRPCYDMIDVSETDALGGVNAEFAAAPQFPSWFGDPRVAVERAPLTGQELWRRERLLDDLDTARFDFEANAPVAQASNLAVETSATTAVALGEQHDRRRATASPSARLDRGWETLDDRIRLSYRRRVQSPETIIETGRWNDDRPPMGTAVETALTD